ncbi:unnamed protein product [Mytilus coruscus]|uniref:Uncharacterized protein n=1 Tax=Mytilus coruscus TaxID=42192 RepID=A0A6J8DAD5_MYTCO|nr:unnamed protein product [Mytilus coruscus]
MKHKDKHDSHTNFSETAECPRTKSVISTNESYRLGKHKEYQKKVQDNIIEYEDPEKFSTKIEQHTDFKSDRLKVPRNDWVKMKNSRVKLVKPPLGWKIYLRTHRIENEVGEYFGMYIPSFKRPSAPWRSMNLQLPRSCKLRFLDDDHYHTLRDHRTSCDFNTVQRDNRPTKQCDSCADDCSSADNYRGNHRT